MIFEAAFAGQSVDLPERLSSVHIPPCAQFEVHLILVAGVFPHIMQISFAAYIWNDARSCLLMPHNDVVALESDALRAANRPASKLSVVVSEIAPVRHWISGP